MSVFTVCVFVCVLCFSDLSKSVTHWSSFTNRTEVLIRKSRQAESPAPIDCKLRSWSAWTPCTSCTDKTLRFQYLERPAQFGGTECVHSQWEEKLCPAGGDCELPDECGEMFTCPESGRCIGQQLRCNGEQDCGLGGDEDDCEEIKSRETKCVGMMRIPGAQRAVQGYNALSDVFVNPVLDPGYYGGVCDYIYNGEWRQLTYDSFCEKLYYNDAEKYFRKPHNFLSYRLLAHSRTEGSSEYYSDAASLLKAKKTESSFKSGYSFGIMYVELGPSVSFEKTLLTNLSRYDSKDVGFVRLVSRVETAHFKMRSADLMLDEDMLQMLMELPEHYDFGSYSRFIQEFGTHYITQGIMGGLLEYILVVKKKAMKEQNIEGSELGGCFGISLGLSLPTSEEFNIKLSAKHETCKKTKTLTDDTQSQSSVIEDVFGEVKGGTTDSSVAQLGLRSASAYRKWGKSLKYSPAVIDYEVLPIYELVRFSSVVGQVGSRLVLLKQAWQEYMQQFNPCRCSPCRNNGVPALSKTSCSCVCAEGFSGPACEKTHRTVPTHGGWSCWGSWTSCTSGTKTRKRECNNPPPKDHGFTCRGASVQNQNC